jgi:hypothetical protein
MIMSATSINCPLLALARYWPCDRERVHTRGPLVGAFSPKVTTYELLGGTNSVANVTRQSPSRTGSARCSHGGASCLSRKLNELSRSILALVNDDKNHRGPHSSTCGATFHRTKPQPDDLALALQAARADQAASKLEQPMVDCGRAYRAPNGALI